MKLKFIDNNGNEMKFDKFGNLIPINVKKKSKKVIDILYDIMTYTVRVKIIHILLIIAIYIAAIGYTTYDYVRLVNEFKNETVPTVSYVSYNKGGPQHQIVDEVERSSSTTVSDNFILSDKVISLIENNDLDLKGIRLSGDIGSSMYITYDPVNQAAIQKVYNEKYAQDVLRKLYISSINIKFVNNMPTYTYVIDWR